MSLVVWARASLTNSSQGEHAYVSHASPKKIVLISKRRTSSVYSQPINGDTGTIATNKQPEVTAKNLKASLQLSNI